MTTFDLVARLAERDQESEASPAILSTRSAASPNPPLHWPSLGPFDAESAWPELIAWVDELRARYPGLDSYVVPLCWFQHESLVAALQALKDHERVAYGSDAPGTAGTDWHRALRELTTMLREFTADLRCPHGPDAAADEVIERFVTDDIARRRRHAATVALGEDIDIQ